MTKPEPIARFERFLLAKFPSAKLSLARPRNPAAVWWLDLTLGDQELTLSWQPNNGFGLYTDLEPGYGARPDELYSDIEALIVRIASIVVTHATGIDLALLRDLSGLSQDEMAVRLNVKQPSVSKVETRKEIKISTLIRYVQALEGTVSIHVSSKKFTVPIDVFQEDDDELVA